MDDGSGGRVAHAYDESIKRFHDVVIEHLVRHDWERSLDERRRLFQDNICAAVDGHEGTRSSGSHPEREEIPPTRVFERRPREEVPGRRVRRDADFNLDCWHGTFSHRVFLMPVRVSR